MKTVFKNKDNFVKFSLNKFEIVAERKSVQELLEVVSGHLSVQRHFFSHFIFWLSVSVSVKKLSGSEM